MRCIQETDLAWALMDAAAPQLTAVERDHIFVTLGAGDTFLAIRLLLKLITAKHIPLQLDLAQRCTGWLNSYALHEEQENLRRLIDRLMIGEFAQGPTAISRRSSTPRRGVRLAVTKEYRAGRLPAQRATPCRAVRYG